MKISIKYNWIILMLLFGCYKKIVQNEKQMERSSESQILELIIPHQANLDWISNVVDNINENQDKVFRDEKYIYRDKNLNPKSTQLKSHLINDHLQDEQYWIPIEDLDTNHKIWHWLSVFVGNYNIVDMRNYLTSEIFDNPEFNKNVDDLSTLFNKTEYLIYQVKFETSKSIEMLKKEDFKKIVELAYQLDMKVKELKRE